MANTRPKTTSNPGTALAREITDLQRRVRTLELRPDPATSSTGGAWCEVSGSDWVDGSTVGAYATANIAIDDQSGGFATVDAQTISCPAGTYIVEWGFSFRFYVDNSGGVWTGRLGHDGWTLWRGGATAASSSVACYTIYNERKLDAMSYLNLSPTGAMEPYPGGGNGMFVWRGMIRAGNPGSNLSLNLVDFNDSFMEALDLSTDFTAFLQAPSGGTGSHFARIAGVG